MKRSMRTTLLMIIVPLVVGLIVSIVFFSGRLETVSAGNKALYYDKLYEINTTLINADRDLYQGMYAVTQYHLQNKFLSETDNQRHIDDYKENTQQALERARQAAEIAKADEMLFTGTTLEGSEETFSDYYSQFEADFAFWITLYDIDTDEGFWTNYCSQFETTREALSEMTDVTEAWAENQVAMQEAAVRNIVYTSFILFIGIAAVLMVLAFIVMNGITKSLKQIKDSINNMAAGDFVSEVAVKSSIKEFSEMASVTDGMRVKLREALIRVVGHAEAVNTGADVTEDSITDSKRTSGDISSAIEDVANGATSMAQDVQDTSSIAIDMGYAVGNVIDVANANMDKGQSLYNESIKVKEQLEELRKADQETDRMAGAVADSVEETAQVVDEISTAAQAIMGIANQTNLLALNASIEAARAGEAGRGFAVVAESIGGLAAESNQTASQITEMLGNITALSQKNKELTGNIKEATTKENAALEEMVSSFDNMLEMLKETEAGNRSIKELAESLDEAKNRISAAVESLSSISEENAASTEETSASMQQLNSNMENIVAEAQNLKAIAIELQSNVGFFRVQ
ncbi:MAG: methyl-accepting chemotaxis protein [Lachnospiraceae bacterium]|nr:methyl-accepting chemotaxis protein [Lachnospiraceae bacterium]